MSKKPLLHDDFAEFLFGEGTNFKAWEYLGAHRYGKSFFFRVWAPHADAVFVCGDFNGWRDDIPLTGSPSGIWAVELKDIPFGEGSKYKFIIRRGSRNIYKADPYALYSEIPAGGASIYTEPKHTWRDGEYLASIADNADYYRVDRMPPKPMNIYEVHLGSWRRHFDGSMMNYREIADRLSQYASEMGYTHVELLPVAEHPFDGSWGYQVCGYYAPTARYGKPEDLMYFVDKMHQSGIGVIFDWVPAHFPKDEHGLYEFDGGPLYEFKDLDRMENAGWGTRCFDVGCDQVRSFLISNALFWLDKYHADGLRVDAVASMLYLDYGRGPGQWRPNPDGSNFAYDAIEFFRRLNNAVAKYFPDRCMIAEESTAFPNVTKKYGLCFTLKWNMGWMHDTLEYYSADPIARASMHNNLTFPLVYAFSENYVLAISHDEVVHLKKNLIEKFPGGYEQKFANLRAYFAYMLTQPGKKLIFMGCEFGQFREWDYNSSLEWFLLDFEKHSSLKRFVADMNRLYKTLPELYELDCDPNGYRWIFADNAVDNIIVYERISSGGERCVVAVNFSGIDRWEYSIPVPEFGVYREIINSDAREYGGNGFTNSGEIRTAPCNGGENRITVRLPALGAAVFKKTSEAQ